LWLGYCSHEASPAKLGPLITYDDETVRPWAEQTVWVQKDVKKYGVERDGQRLLYPAYNPLCTGAYAVTLAGARKMLYEIGYDHLLRPVDIEYQKVFMSNKLPGLLVMPPLMGQFRTGSSRDSDVNPKVQLRPMDTNLKKASSGPHIAQSARRKLAEWTYGQSRRDPAAGPSTSGVPAAGSEAARR
jgi:hypothetical protein